MKKIAVVGATGYAGAELVRILAGHPNVELTLLTSRQYAGEKFSEIYPALSGVVDQICKPFSAEIVADAADLAFTALPHKLPMEIVPQLLQNGIKVIDLSADFRFSNADTYEAAYQPHSARELLDESVYGLCEIYAERIRSATLVGNPGCYPTSILLPLIPLLESKLIRPEGLVADSKSGVSGAGRSPSLTSLFSEVAESFKAYKVTAHRHNPEIDEILSEQSQKRIHVTFVPHLVPMSRGMFSTIYAELVDGVCEDDIRGCLEKRYATAQFVRLRPSGKLPDSRHVRGTNLCEIGFSIDAPNRRLILLSAIDNLVKGAAGQAVQNMNLMLGFPENAGLTAVPFPV